MLVCSAGKPPRAGQQVPESGYLFDLTCSQCPLWVQNPDTENTTGFPRPSHP